MGRFFPKLTQTHVFIETDTAGHGFNCPMLPVSALVEMNAIFEILQKAGSIDSLESARKRMIELIKTVMPEAYHANLGRLDIPRLTELLAYLMYGDPGNDDQPREEPEKNGSGGAAGNETPPVTTDTSTTTTSPAG